MQPDDMSVEAAHFYNSLGRSKVGGGMTKRQDTQHSSNRASSYVRAPGSMNTTAQPNITQPMSMYMHQTGAFTPHQTEQLYTNIPAHLLKALYSIRHISTLENRVRLLHCLNFFRSIQKRLTLDCLETYSR